MIAFTGGTMVRLRVLLWSFAVAYVAATLAGTQLR